MGDNGTTQKSAKDIKDEIRAKTIGSANIFKSRIVSYDGIEVEIKEPSVKDWGEILEKVTSGSTDEENKGMDFKEYLIWSVICCSYVPGTSIRVFEDTDYETFLGKPKSGFITEFSDIAGELMRVDTETAAKNLNVTEGDKPSLPSQS